MSNTTKKYASLSTLQTFLDNLKNLFAAKTVVDDLSAEVAYIDVEDNENITEAQDAIITNDELNELASLLEDEV